MFAAERGRLRCCVFCPSEAVLLGEGKGVLEARRCLSGLAGAVQEGVEGGQHWHCVSISRPLFLVFEHGW